MSIIVAAVVALLSAEIIATTVVPCTLLTQLSASHTTVTLLYAFYTLSVQLQTRPQQQHQQQRRHQQHQQQRCG
jgi:hypothetical protein